LSEEVLIQEICDISTESLVIGNIVNNISILNEYNELIVSKFDFSDSSLKFLYDLLFNTFLNHTEVNETSINIQVSKMDEESKSLYQKLGGHKSYQRLSAIAKSNTDFKKLYTKLKSYNLIRELDHKGFNVRKYLDKLVDKTPDQILKAYELQLTRVGSYIKNISDSVILGHDVDKIYEQFKESPDYGIDLPYPILNSLARGWRQGKIYCSAMHSGFGKSREAVDILAHTSVIGQTPVLFGINEQEKIEVDLMLLTRIANTVFAPKHGVFIEETDIAMGLCTGVKDDICRQAAQYIKERSKIHFLELESWDFDSLKITLKKHKLRGINFAIIDTFKAMRGGDTHGMADWMLFVYTIERLKKMIGSEAQGGLNMGLWLTMQMTDESLISKIMGSSAIATGKQSKHHMDFLKMSRMLDYKDKEKIRVRIQMPDNVFNGSVQALDKQKTYYMAFMDKNRGGKDKSYIIYEVDKGKMLWKELGLAVFHSEVDEEIAFDKE